MAITNKIGSPVTGDDFFNSVRHCSGNGGDFNLWIRMKRIENIWENTTAKRILSLVKEDGKTDHIPQIMFIKGRQGSGKTSLLETVGSKLKNNGWEGHLLIFDGRQFFSSKDIIDAIDEATADNTLQKEQTDSNLRMVVIIDDMDYYLKRSSFDDQYVLRSYLYKNTSPLLIGSISKIDRSLAEYRAPFFEGVRLIEIPKLDLSILDALEISEEIRERIRGLMQYLPATIGSLKSAMNVIETSDNKTNDLRELLSRESAVYRQKYESMPEYSQKILYYMAQASDPTTLTSLRSLTNLPAGTLSTYIRLLLKSGDIRKTNSQKRGTPYEISDKLFKLWLTGSRYKT